jgi:hypothetical protein
MAETTDQVKYYSSCYIVNVMSPYTVLNRDRKSMVNILIMQFFEVFRNKLAKFIQISLLCLFLCAEIDVF